MKEFIRVVKVGQDTLENSVQYWEVEIGVFVANDKLSAHGVAEEYIKNLSPHGHYLGWDGQVWPQYKIIKGELK